MKNSKKKLGLMTRRQTLAALGGCGLIPFFKNPLDVLVSNLVEGIIHKAHAEAGLPSKNYVYVSLQGAPNRWAFDLPLNPNGESIVANGHVLNRFGGTGVNAGAAQYSSSPVTVNGVTLTMPHLWQNNIPTSQSASSTVAMTEILKNMLMIRGINMRFDGHEPNQIRNIRPIGSAPSISGLVGDRSNRALPSTALREAVPINAHRSEKGIALVPFSLSSTNALSSLLGPFNTSSDGTASLVSRRNAIDSSVQRALAALGQYSKSSNPGAENLFGLRNQAENLIRKGIGDASTQFIVLRDKYENLISRSATTPILGVTDRPVLYSDFGNLSTQYQRPSGSTFVPDTVGRRATKVEDQYAINNPDLRTLLQANSSIVGLSTGFAVAEYLLTQGLSSSIMIGSTALINMNFQGQVDWETGAERMINQAGATVPFSSTQGVIGFDSHELGGISALISDSFLYRGLAACLYEFISVLKANNLFNDTLIHIGSEFGRIPRNDLSGSDHGWSAHNITLISGVIDKPAVVGNVVKDGDTPGTPQKDSSRGKGAWGMAAPVKVDGTDRHLDLGHAVSTIANILGVETPTKANSPVALLDNSGKAVPIIEPAAQKDRS